VSYVNSYTVHDVTSFSGNGSPESRLDPSQMYETMHIATMVNRTFPSMAVVDSNQDNVSMETPEGATSLLSARTSDKSRKLQIQIHEGASTFVNQLG
jgi:hypothetical protein